MVGTQQVVEEIWYARYNDKGKAITKLYAEKQLHRLINFKHPIYYVISTLWQS
jgi:hypothetical protein